MKELRFLVTTEEYEKLQSDANQMAVSLKKLIHDRTVNAEEGPLSSAMMIAKELSKYREVLNQIIQREITADIRLYEDDVILLEQAMAKIENNVASFIRDLMRKGRVNGNP